MITIVDYGMGNLRSVAKAVEKYTDTVRVSSDPASIDESSAIIMPGDGAFGMAMQHLRERGWIEPIKNFIMRGGFFFGICLGFQLLFDLSEEFGTHQGLGIIRGAVKRFDVEGLTVPHMGWNTVEFCGLSPFLNGIPSGTYFYFIHSYRPEGVDESWVLGRAAYGGSFPCIIGRGNLIATQFHPEKSHAAGLRLIENFVRSSCSSFQR